MKYKGLDQSRVERRWTGNRFETVQEQPNTADSRLRGDSVPVRNGKYNHDADGDRYAICTSITRRTDRYECPFMAS